MFLDMFSQIIGTFLIKKQYLCPPNAIGKECRGLRLLIILLTF